MTSYAKRSSGNRILLTGPAIPILATIPLHGGGNFIERIRRLPDAETVLVTRENRETLPKILAGKLSHRPVT